MSDAEAMRFRKSSYSGSGNNCVEVADTAHGSAVRDTQNREAGYLAFDRAEWAAFLRPASRDHA